jgi:hypothetical protein
MGEVVDKFDFDNNNNLDIQKIIDTEYYSSGIYNFILISPMRKHHKKIMIMK